MNPRISELLLAASSVGGEPPHWSSTIFAVLFVGMWLFVTTVLARMAGHMMLLKWYPPQEEPVTDAFRFASGSMRWVNFSSALYVGIGARGLHLAPSWLFRPLFHRGIPCVPWEALRCVRPQSTGLLGWFQGSKFELEESGLQFTVLGRAGRAIEHRLGIQPVA